MKEPRTQYYSERPAYDDRRAASKSVNQHIDDFLARGGSIDRLPTSPGFVDMSPIPKMKQRRRADGSPDTGKKYS